MPAVITQAGGNLIDVGGYISFKAFCHQEGQIGINDYSYIYEATTGTIMSFGEAAKAFCDMISAAYADWLTTEGSFLGVKATPLANTVLALPGIAEDFLPGTEANEPLPNQTCGMIKWTTTLIGRANRGRTYLPFPSEAYGTSGTGPNAAGVAKITAIRDAVSSPFTVVGASSTYTFYHRVFHKATNLGTPVVQGVVGTRWGTQRRRGGYGKTNPAVIT